jgi:hypothetical protein
MLDFDVRCFCARALYLLSVAVVMLVDIRASTCILSTTIRVYLTCSVLCACILHCLHTVDAGRAATSIS